MNIELLQKLSNKYAQADLNFMQALRTWKESNLSPEMIREQVNFDIRYRLSAANARDLHLAGSKMKNYGFKLEDFGIADNYDSKLVPKDTLKSDFSPRKTQFGGMVVQPKDYEISEGRTELLPDNIKNKEKIKFTPTVRMSVEKIGDNLYRSKTAGSKYWTLKEKVGEDGNKAMYLVAVEVDDALYIEVLLL